MKAFIAVGSILVLLIVGLGMAYIGFSNDANKYEVDIPSVYNNNKNVYDNGWKKVKEMAQVPDMQTADLQKLYDAAMKGRYGSDGSKALVNFIQEQNPNLNQETYLKIQRAVESFHDEFQANQTKLISFKQEYGRFLYTNTNSRLLNGFFGLGQRYPHIKCGVPDGTADDYQIVTSDKTEDDFKAHKAEPLKLR